MELNSFSLAFFILWIIFSSVGILRVIAAARDRAKGSVVGTPFDTSRICPILDLTINSEPKYLLMVLALAGDSTITNDFPIELYYSLN